MVIRCQYYAKYFVHIISFSHNNLMIYVLLPHYIRPERLSYLPKATLILISKARICMSLKHTSWD